MQLLKDAFSILFIHKISSCSHCKEDVGQYRPRRPSQAKSKKCWLEPKWLRNGNDDYDDGNGDGDGDGNGDGDGDRDSDGDGNGEGNGHGAGNGDADGSVSR